LTAARAFTNQLKAHPSLPERVRRFFTSSTDPTEQGLYFVGPVGTGKTHLIAATYHALHPEVPCAFLHASTLFRSTARPARYATALAERCDVLCLDEVEIDDPANEVRLVRVLHALKEHGVKLLATSNVKPEQFMANRMGSGRFERFLQEQFAERYRLVFVGGDDYRLHGTNGHGAKGKGWIGPREQAHRALRESYHRCAGDRLWLSFDELRDAARSTAHDRLLARLTSYDHLFIAGVQIQDTDDALRLLRIVDALYMRPDAPQLHLSSETPPARWFHTADQGNGIAGDVAKKFARTTSRLHALCDIETIAPSGASRSDAND
jgi:cell division protein ZapE